MHIEVLFKLLSFRSSLKFCKVINAIDDTLKYFKNLVKFLQALHYFPSVL